MSQVTRCPACGTSFKVVPDQLRISQGWVRCGQCNEVFDASRELREQAASIGERAAGGDVPPAPAPVPNAQHATPDAIAPMPVPAAVDEAPVHEHAGADLDPAAPTLVHVAPQWLQSAPAEIPISDPAASLDIGFAEYQQAQTQAEDHAAAGAAGLPDPDGVAASVAPDQPLEQEPDDADETAPQTPGPERLFVAIAPDAPAKAEGMAAVDAMPLPQRPAVQSPVVPGVARDARVSAPAPLAPRTPAADPAHADVSFLRDAAEATPASARSGSRRALWAGAAAVLLLVLLAQWALHARDRIAATAPALRPLLQSLCVPLQCSIQPLRRIDAIVIDGSAFIALGENGYRLSLTLRNRASHAVALPAVALSLTDIQEQPVVRRVLLPDELGAPPPELPAHGEWSTSVDLQIADNAGRARVVGYRLDAFYP